LPGKWEEWAECNPYCLDVLRTNGVAPAKPERVEIAFLQPKARHFWRRLTFFIFDRAFFPQAPSVPFFLWCLPEKTLRRGRQINVGRNGKRAKNAHQWPKQSL
jgi:hypothetical protein